MMKNYVTLAGILLATVLSVQAKNIAQMNGRELSNVRFDALNADQQDLLITKALRSNLPNESAGARDALNKKFGKQNWDSLIAIDGQKGFNAAKAQLSGIGGPHQKGPALAKSPVGDVPQGASADNALLQEYRNLLESKLIPLVTKYFKKMGRSFSEIQIEDLKKYYKDQVAEHGVANVLESLKNEIAKFQRELDNKAPSTINVDTGEALEPVVHPKMTERQGKQLATIQNKIRDYLKTKYGTSDPNIERQAQSTVDIEILQSKGDFGLAIVKLQGYLQGAAEDLDTLKDDYNKYLDRPLNFLKKEDKTEGEINNYKKEIEDFKDKNGLIQAIRKLKTDWE